MNAKPPRAGRYICANGTGRDGNAGAEVSKAAAGKAKVQRQHVPHPPSQDAQHRRSKRPCAARRPSRCRKSWVPMGGAPRTVRCMPRSEGPAATNSRPPSVTVSVELERAIWNGAIVGTASGVSRETQQIRGASAMPRSLHLWDWERPSSAGCSGRSSRPQSAGYSGRSSRITQERRPESGMTEASPAENYGCEEMDSRLDTTRTAEAEERQKRKIEMLLHKIDVQNRLSRSRLSANDMPSEISQVSHPPPRMRRPTSAPPCGVRKSPAAVAWAVRHVSEYDIRTGNVVPACSTQSSESASYPPSSSGC